MSLFSLLGLAQQISTEVGRVTTRFDYENSDGEQHENLNNDSGFSYAVSYRHQLSPKLFLGGRATFNQYGSFGSDPVYNNYYSWKTDYLGLGLELDGEFYRRGGLSVITSVGGSPQFFLNGTQTTNTQVADLKGVEQFDRPFFFLHGGLGLNYCFDQKAAICVRYRYGLGKPMGTSDDLEKLDLTTHTINIGVMWNFINCKYCIVSKFVKKRKIG